MIITSNLQRKLTLLGIAAGSVGVFVLAQLAFADVSGTLLPLSDGAYLQWTPSTGTTHYVLVDESSCNGTTDYNSTNGVGNRDAYGLSLASIPNGSTITAIEITPCASNNKQGGGTASTLNVFYRFNGTDSADAGSYALTGTTPVQLAATTFSGLSFVKGASSALQIGAVLSAGGKGARLSRIAAVITYTPLAAPSSLAAVNISASQNNLTWTDNSSNEDGFKIERSLNNQFGPWTQIATTTAGAVSYSDTGLTADQTYYYRVRAFNSGGDSAYSNTAFAITYSTAPNAPSNLTATASSTNAVLNWTDNSTNEDGFKIERSADNLNFTQINTVGVNVKTYIDPSLASGIYYYRVRAFNVIGDSAYSNTASTTIP